MIYLLIFYVGIAIGFFIRAWLVKRSSYAGTIYVNKHEKRTLYSLVLDDYPETLEFRKEVVFKVDASNIDTSEPEQSETQGIFAPEAGSHRE
jgi:hypothetical protein